MSEFFTTPTPATSPPNPELNTNETKPNGLDGFIEPILRPSLQRFIMRPSRPEYPDMYKMFKQHQALQWTTEEIDLGKDRWDTLDEAPRHFLSRVLAFFAIADGIVNENINCNFADEVQCWEARSFYDMQAYIERVHAETYSILIETYIKDRSEQEKLFASVVDDPSIRRKAEWALKWMNSDNNSFAERIVAFAAVEGIFFAGSFAAIFWIKKQLNKYKLPGLCFSNELISRDENLHCQFACLEYHHLERKLPKERVYEIVNEAVEAEIQFITESVKVEMVDMSPDSMAEHIRFMADFLIKQLGYPVLYGAKEPFDWFGMISIEGKTNFFEKRVSEYSKARVGCGPRADEDTLVLDADV